MSSFSNATTTAAAAANTNDDRNSSSNNNNINTSTNTTMAASIRQHRQLLQDMQRTLTQLQHDHRTRIIHASLERDAAYVWKFNLGDSNVYTNSCSQNPLWMTARERQDPALILKSLASKKLPQCMEWRAFDSCFGPAIRKEATLLLARLKHVPGFEKEYTSMTPFVIPAALRGHEQVVKEICKRNPAAVKYVNKALLYQNQAEIVQIVIQATRYKDAHFILPFVLPSSPSSKSKSSKSSSLALDTRIFKWACAQFGMQTFCYWNAEDKLPPNRLRALVLWAIKQTDHGIDHSSINNNNNNKYEEHLKYVMSDELRADEEVVMEAVRRRGSNLRFVKDANLLEQEDLVQAAVEQDGAALQYLPDDSPIKQHYLQTPHLFRQVLDNSGGCLWLDVLKKSFKKNKTTKHYRKNPDFLLTAVQNGLELPPDELLRLARYRKPLFVQVCIQATIEQTFPALFNSTPSKIAKMAIVDDAMKFLSLKDALRVLEERPNLTSTMAKVILKGCPSLAQSVPANLVLARCGFIDLVQMWDHPQVALTACQANYIAYTKLPEKDNLELIRAAFGSACKKNLNAVRDLIFSIPSQVYSSHHEIVVLAIESLSDDYFTRHPMEYTRLYRRFTPSVFGCHRVVMAWIRKGWEIRSPFEFDDWDWQHNEEILLTLIRQRGVDGMHYACPHLRRDWEFCEKAVRANPSVLSYTLLPQSMREDFSLLLRATADPTCQFLIRTSHAQSRRDSSSSSTTAIGQFETLVEFAQKVRDRLEQMKGFWQVLAGMISNNIKLQRRCAKRRRKTIECHLPMLDCGLETGVAIKKLIASYVGIPSGPEVALFQPALDNLQVFGY